MKIDWKILIGAILVCQLAGIIGSIFTFSSIPTWYASLAKPSFSPPNWVFGPVWTTLYTLMGISLYLIYKSKNKLRNPAMVTFAIQLILNAIWSIVFFGLKSPLGGLIIIFLLWAYIANTLLRFYAIDKNAGYLLVPYLLWVTFASVLNYYIFALN
jgi:tryptophan-rich sensory protein